MRRRADGSDGADPAASMDPDDRRGEEHVPDNELTMARAALKPGMVLAGVAALLAGLLRGLPAAGTAALGVAVVVGAFALTGWSLHHAARRGLRALRMTALGGFVLRLVAYGVGVAVLLPVEAIDRPVLGITVGVAAVSLLAFQAGLLLRRREFWWVHPDVRGRETA